jgi:nucleoside-diphosphate-sugar epimerase
MILLTGQGAIAQAFSNKYPCKVASIRHMSDDELKDEIINSSVIIHNSALVGSYNLDELITSNFLLTKKIIDTIYITNPSCRFINLSSMSFLDTEDDTLLLNYMSNYGLSKYLSEHYCLNHALKNVCSVRFSTIFYQNSQRDGISKIISDAYYNRKITTFNNGIDARDILPLDIAVEYLFKICQYTESKKVFNVVSGKSTQFIELIALIKKHLTFDVVDIKNETKKILSDFSTKHIECLGIIDFDIEDYIINYIERIVSQNNDEKDNLINNGSATIASSNHKSVY